MGISNQYLLVNRNVFLIFIINIKIKTPSGVVIVLILDTTNNFTCVLVVKIPMDINKSSKQEQNPKLVNKS